MRYNGRFWIGIVGLYSFFRATGYEQKRYNYTVHRTFLKYCSHGFENLFQKYPYQQIRANSIRMCA